MSIRIGLVALFCLWALPAAAQPRMPVRGIEIIDALYSRFTALAHSNDDDDRRQLTRTIIEQFVCEFPDDGYGGKSASTTRPFSKDAIAKLEGGRLYIWDWQNGTTRRRLVQAGQRAEDVTGQNFIPVGCQDWLGVGNPTPAPTPPPVPQPLPTPPSPSPPAPVPPVIDTAQLIERLLRVEQGMGALAIELRATHTLAQEAVTEIKEHRAGVSREYYKWTAILGIPAGIIGTYFANRKRGS